MSPSFQPLTSPAEDGHRNADTAIKDPALSKPGVNGKVQTPDSPLPAVSDLDSKAYKSQDVLLADIIESLRVSGGCVIRNLVSENLVKEVEGEVRPYLEKAEPWNGEFGRFIRVVVRMLSISGYWSLLWGGRLSLSALSLRIILRCVSIPSLMNYCLGTKSCTVLFWALFSLSLLGLT